MYMTYGFKMGKVGEGRFYNHPPLGIGDIQKLQEIFSNYPIWQAKTSELGNVYFPTQEQALTFYRALVEHAKTHELSEAEYIAGGTVSSVLVKSNLKELFRILINFFHQELKAAGILPDNEHQERTNREINTRVLALSILFSAGFL